MQKSLYVSRSTEVREQWGFRVLHASDGQGYTPFGTFLGGVTLTVTIGQTRGTQLSPLKLTFALLDMGHPEWETPLYASVCRGTIAANLPTQLFSRETHTCLWRQSFQGELQLPTCYTPPCLRRTAFIHQIAQGKVDLWQNSIAQTVRKMSMSKPAHI